VQRNPRLCFSRARHQVTERRALMEQQLGNRCGIYGGLSGADAYSRSGVLVAIDSAGCSNSFDVVSSNTCWCGSICSAPLGETPKYVPQKPVTLPDQSSGERIERVDFSLFGCRKVFELSHPINRGPRSRPDSTACNRVSWGTTRQLKRETDHRSAKYVPVICHVRYVCAGGWT
jgi:hypothetical protein